MRDSAEHAQAIVEAIIWEIPASIDNGGSPHMKEVNKREHGDLDESVFIVLVMFYNACTYIPIDCYAYMLEYCLCYTFIINWKIFLRHFLHSDNIVV